MLVTADWIPDVGTKRSISTWKETAGRDGYIAAELRRGLTVKLRMRLSCPGRFRLQDSDASARDGPPHSGEAEQARREQSRRWRVRLAARIAEVVRISLAAVSGLEYSRSRG
jgi:hypothetical protein